jgi:mRNA interferase HicA
MKRRDFLSDLTEAGCVFLRRGGCHDLWLNPRNGKKASVPRHAEIKKQPHFNKVGSWDLDLDFDFLGFDFC